MNELLLDIVFLLAAAVLVVPLTQKVGLGSVLGYLIAGLAIGPHGFKFITATESIAQVSELGVVFLLFIIGLELDPKRLWKLRIPIFGMGLAQVLLVCALTTGLGLLCGLSWPTGVIVGLGFAMSSTAISTQILKERGMLASAGGSSAFSILLFQDIAVIPILALLPWLAGAPQPTNAQPAWKIVLVVAFVIFAGHYLMRHVFRLVASAHLREVFTALSLLMVVGLAALMQSLGVSMALGAFLGGVLLATSEYRHAIETDIEPFKGLLLGLFFMAVGMSVDIPTIFLHPEVVLGLVVSVIVLKIVAHALLALVFRLGRKEIPFFSLVLSQVGEFAFVLFAAATGLGLLSAEMGAELSAAIAISMAVTPLLMAIYDRFIAPRLARSHDMSHEVMVNEHPEVLIAGFGRVGQIIGRLLYANRIRATVLDHDPDQIELVRRFGFKVYYGDATRLDLLESAGAGTAKILVVAVDDSDASLLIVDLAQQHFPHLRIVVRARNVAHVYDLMDRKVEIWERETFDSSLRLGTEVLRMLGWAPYQAVRAGFKFRKHNLKLLFEMASKRGNQRELVSVTKQAREDLEKMFAGEGEQLRRDDEGWVIHPEGR